jgi:hypothetical protein
MTDENKLLKAEVERLKKELSLFTPSLALMLERKGFIIYKKEPSADLLVPYRKFKRAFYEKLKKYSAEYLDFLLRSKIAEEEGKFYRLRKLPVKSFGVTLEWFVAELMRNDMHADVVWGVKFKRPKVGGDYDILAKIDSSLLYMEIKSSPPKQIYDREITSFLNRTEDLSPDIAIFFVDTELRMKDKIVPMFEDELKRRYKRTIRIDRLVKELFHINGKIFIINAKDSISANIQTVMTFVYHKEFEIT